MIYFFNHLFFLNLSKPEQTDATFLTILLGSPTHIQFKCIPQSLLYFPKNKNKISCFIHNVIIWTYWIIWGREVSWLVSTMETFFLMYVAKKYISQILTAMPSVISIILNLLLIQVKHTFLWLFIFDTIRLQMPSIMINLRPARLGFSCTRFMG